MSQTLAHRGPDGRGFYTNGNIALAHQRLAIIDLATGDQPMYNEDKSIVIIFNGEIYNYIELRNELKSLGHHLATNSDTEVLIHAYEQWGVNLHDKLNGVWAFALWDNRKKQLMLSRDRLGEKPLHYAVHDNTLVFASEIRALLAYGLPRTPQLSVLEIYLTLGYIPTPFTFFDGIQELKPAHYILVENGRFSEHRYWKLPDIDESDMLSDRKKIYEQFESLLRDSVRIRMRSDVDYGVFLSGGLDSSSIVAVMSEINRNHPVQTFTIGYENKKFDERKLAYNVSFHFKTNHHQYVVKPDSFEQSLQKIAEHFDDPFGDSSAIAVSHVSSYAKKCVKMVLSGDGGDEILSGYNCYQSEKFAVNYQRLPQFLQAIPPLGLSLGSKITPREYRIRLTRLHRVIESSRFNLNDRILCKACWAPITLVRQLTSHLHNQIIPADDFLADFMSKCTYKDNFYRLMYYNHMLTLPEQMLTKVDRMSMAYSLEVRTPFLDHRLVEFMAKVHKNVKMKGYQRKTILRETIGRKLPSPILKAPKKGFAVPLHEWFKDKHLTDSLKNLLAHCPLELDINAVNTAIEQNANGYADYGNFIWMLFVLGKWFEK